VMSSRVKKRVVFSPHASKDHREEKASMRGTVDPREIPEEIPAHPYNPGSLHEVLVRDETWLLWNYGGVHPRHIESCVILVLDELLFHEKIASDDK